MRRVAVLVLVAGGVVAASAAQAQAQGRGGAVPNGTYACQAWIGSSYVNMGKVRTAGGKVSPDPVAKTGGTITGVTPTKEGIAIAYTTRRGYKESMDCKRGG